MTVESRQFPCDNCGADLRFHIGVQSLKCDYCGSEKTITLDADAAVAEQDFHGMLAKMRDQRSQSTDAASNDLREFTCDNCGGTVAFLGTITSDECAYCGTVVALDKVHDAADRVPVDGVLPFQIDRDTARKNLKAWVKSRWFAPNEFLRRGVQGIFNGMYLPYWTFDSFTQTHWEGQRGDNYTVTVGSGKNRRTETRTRWSWRSGSFQRIFDDVLLAGTTQLPQNRLEDLAPWPLERCRPFDESFLAGYLASTYDVELDHGFEAARNVMETRLQQIVRGEIGGDHQRITKMDVFYDAITYKHLLLPVWTLVYRYHGKPYQVFVNAGTGEVQGDRPWSWIKITLAILFGIALVVGGILLYQHFQSPSNMPTNFHFDRF